MSKAKPKKELEECLRCGSDDLSIETCGSRTDWLQCLSCGKWYMPEEWRPR